jgi:tRNA threonylcarbamoyladenosine biosynthesis protein TsaE
VSGERASQCVVVTREAAETRALGAALAQAARAGDLLSLVGELGAGKTQFAKGFGAGLGVTELAPGRLESRTNAACE